MSTCALRQTASEGRGFLTPPETLDALKSWGVNLLSLSNNHAFDLGATGIQNTLREANRRQKSRDRTRPSAQTLTSAEVERPRLAETSAETSWALAAPALRASRPPPSAAAPIARFIHKFTWSSPW